MAHFHIMLTLKAMQKVFMSSELFITDIIHYQKWTSKAHFKEKLKMRINIFAE